MIKGCCQLKKKKKFKIANLQITEMAYKQES